MSDVLPFDAITAADAPRVGGKALSLAEMARAGLPVPPGFAIPTGEYQRLRESGLRSDPTLVAAVLRAFHSLGGSVAVRSSASDEDGVADSFAGQQETILGVTGDDELLTAIERCWKSLHTERATAYRKKKGIADAAVAMAVVVQKLVAADSAGVLFTRNPAEPNADHMIVEASYGLGEAVVSGRVTPDRFVLDRDTGKVVERHLGRKTVRVVNGHEEPVPVAMASVFCINDDLLSRVAEMGRRVEAHYGNARDIEWATADGQLYLLQARPITATWTQRTDVRAEVIATLRALADPRGTVWVRYNLSEILPQPTPMTWAVVQRLLAADGGIGTMNRDLGGDPDPTLGRLTGFDLVAGRPMANLARMPRLQFTRSPFEYPFAKFRADPRSALDPKPVVNPLKDGVFVGLLRLPGLMWRLSRMASAVRKQSEEFAAEFLTKIAPPFAAAARSAIQQDWSKLDSPAVLKLFQEWVTKTLVEFARHSLKPTFFAETAWSNLVETLKPKLGEEGARLAVSALALGARPAAGTSLSEAFHELASGRTDRAAFLERFGHRAANEMELAAPRWSELADLPAGTTVEPSSHSVPPVDTVIKESQLSGAAEQEFRRQVERLRTFLGLRESAKHYLLMGYAVVRRALVELDTRHNLNGGIFDLVPDELPALIAGTDLHPVISARRTRRQVERTLEVPPVLFSDDLDAIGRPIPPPDGAAALQGIPLSAGTAEGTALVLTEPTDAPDEEGYVLVCPSTDPAWVPLFAKARALVMETGGVLSHGAIVAREFGLPAVAGLPDATRQVKTGQRLCVDGGTGLVTLLDS